MRGYLRFLATLGYALIVAIATASSTLLGQYSLTVNKERLLNAQTLQTLASEGFDRLYEQEGSVFEQLGRLQRLGSISPSTAVGRGTPSTLHARAPCRIRQAHVQQTVTNFTGLPNHGSPHPNPEIGTVTDVFESTEMMGQSDDMREPRS